MFLLRSLRNTKSNTRFRLVVNRDSKFTNFVEFRTHKVIYRRYAGLFFSLCVDITDNELAYLECIYLFVEILDNFFSNVCELNLVFNFHKQILQLRASWMILVWP
ncbi:AP-2 complex subunit sigma isoform X2 [Brassica napus]|uniref:AP-2 complex subunit sigma isoform X2 n=1 Tax=Brassica napus TaxID=3708 RepID=UPI002079728B|nr:AP-2 complex subunit sigma isoform X2 [Brassica napus]